MKRKRFAEEHHWGLKEVEAGVSVSDRSRKHGVSKATFYTWRQRYGGMEVNEAKRERERDRRASLGASCTSSRLPEKPRHG